MNIQVKEIQILTERLALTGTLALPVRPIGVVLFAHGGGSGSASPQNRAVAQTLNRRRLATLLFDLLTLQEAGDRDNSFDIPLLAERLVLATSWVKRRDELAELPIGYFGRGTGAAAALRAAAELGTDIGAIVSCGGRVDMAASVLSLVTAPTLLFVDSFDDLAVDLSRSILPLLPHGELFVTREGKSQEVAEHAAAWFAAHLAIHRAGTAA